MNPQNLPIAQAFIEIADLLELQRADPARVRAYRRASARIAALHDSVRGLLHRGDAVTNLADLGKGMSDSAIELAQTGHCAVLDRLQAEAPLDFSELLALPLLGPKRVRVLHEELGVSTLEQLLEAARNGQLQSLPGFGPRLEQQLLRLAAEHMSRPRRVRLDVALPAAQRLAAWLARVEGARRVELTGPLRRGCDGVDEVSLIAESAHERQVVTAFVSHPEVCEVPLAGGTRATVVLNDGLRASLHVAAPDRFGAAWVTTTGSASHVEALLRVGRRHHLSLDDHGLHGSGAPAQQAREDDIYRALGLDPIPPELREGRGEVEAAATGALPRLLEAGELRGDLHVRTRDGARHTPLEALARAARARGLAYVVVADAVRRLDRARGSDVDAFLRQADDIDRLNAAGADVLLLKGIEVEILEDGRLSVPDEVLAHADLVLATLGHPVELTRARQTDRLLHALDQRHFSILSSPTGRRVDERRGAVFDLPRVLARMAQRGAFIELDCRADRLDLDDEGCRLAREAGVLVALGSHAARPEEFDALDYGLLQARRGWLEAGHVLNSRPPEALRALLAPTMRRTPGG